jgi:glycerophosphoryl diester phosphodiesterase
VTSPSTGFPYLDRRLDDPGSILALAHRGGALHPGLVGLENTLAAFEHAAAMGYEYVETDLHATSDGVLVAFHDDILDRVTDGAGRLADHTWHELSELRIGGTQPIPRFVDLLDALPGVRFNLDLKAPGATEPLVRLIAERDLADRVNVGSFSEPTIRRFRRLAGPRVSTAAGKVGTALHRYAPFGSHLVGILGDSGAVFQVPLDAIGRRLVTREFVEQAHARRKHVHVWTIDDEAVMEELIDLGVDGIVTDRTDVLKDVLLRRNQWREPHGPAL